jgi:hypothetical protein
VKAWFNENCSPFDEKYGMVPMNFAELGLTGAQRSLFKMKLNEMVQAIAAMRADADEKAMAGRA